ncbi:MAG: DUF4363 family protein [Clostridia bacterium]|nr:DUF4363 family protein [Clostridia bacterium]
MKTFVSCLIIFALLCTFVFTDSFFKGESIARLLEMAEALPEDDESFENNKEELSEKAEKIYSLWKKSRKKLEYVASYALIEAADEAMGELYGAYKANDADGFLPAAVKFRDSLERLAVLFGVSFQSLA